MLDYYIRSLEGSVREVNTFLSRTRNPAVATSASSMKDDLRETKDLLESITLP